MYPTLLTPKEFHEVPVLHRLCTEAESALEFSDDDLLFYELLSKIHSLDVVGRLQDLSINPFLRPLWERVSILDSCARAKLDADLATFQQLGAASESIYSNQELQQILRKMKGLDIPKKLGYFNGVMDLQARCTRMLEAVAVKVGLTQTTTTTTTTTTARSLRGFVAPKYLAPNPFNPFLDLSVIVSSILDSWIETAPSLEEKQGRQEAKNRICAFLEASSPHAYLSLISLDLSALPADLFKLSAFNRKLTNFHLSNNPLAVIPPEIGLLTQLTHFSLSGSPFSGYSLTTIPAEIGCLTRLKYLNLARNRLTTMPPEIGGLIRLTHFDLRGNQVTRIPIEIGCLIYLEDFILGANHLTTIPSEIGRLTQLKRLDIDHNQLTTIPSEIGLLAQLKHLDLSYNPHLRALPNEILQLPSSCSIDISGCQFSTTVLERIREQTQAEGYVGPRIYFSIPEARLAERPIEELLKELHAIAGMENLSQKALEAEWAKDPDFKENLCSWLSRISWIADFKKGGEGKTRLARRIISYLEHAVKDEMFLNVFKANLVGSTETCGDRVTLSIVDIGIEYRLATFDKKDLVGLKNLIARGVLAMEILRDAAREKVKSLRMVDEIEVYLGYPIRLRERLQLPIDVEDMLYFACSSLTAADLNAAAELVESALANEQVVYEYLIAHHIWIEALKQNDPDGFEAIETKVGELMEAGAWGQVGKVRTQMLIDLSRRLLKK